MWKDYDLPSFVIIEGKKFEIKTDWKNIIDIFECFNDENLTKYEKFDCLIDLFYKDYEKITDGKQALDYLYLFINGNRKEEQTKSQKSSGAELKLVDWQKDLPLIIPPVNKVLGYDVREKKHLHWWTFLGAFNEITECTFKTYVGIRYKIAKHKKLEDFEKEIYRTHKQEIDIKNNVTQYDNFDDEDILMKMAREKNTLFIE